MRILAFSDLHGNVEALKRMFKSVEEEAFDHILIAGDLTNMDVGEPEVVVKQAKEIFDILEGFELPYYFVWGMPFRESRLFFTHRAFKNVEEWTVERKGERVRILSKPGTHGRISVKIDEMSAERYEAAVEILEMISALKFGKLLNEVERVSFGDFTLTSNPNLVDEKTVLMIHCYRKPTKALLQLEGHVHYGQLCRNYLNLGFVSRSDGLLGCCWLIDLSKGKPSIEWVNFGGRMKEMVCPIHRDEGVFYVPDFWKKCPVCRDPNNAIFSREIERRSSVQVGQGSLDDFLEND